MGGAMRQLLRRCNNAEPWFTMGMLGTATTTIAAYLANPRLDTFHSGKAWDLIESIHLGGFHPEEAAWALAFGTLGLAMLLSTWLLSEAVNERGRPLAEMVYAFSRLVWGTGAVCWGGLGASFFLSNPAGIAPVLAIVFGTIPSAWVATRVRKAAESARGVEGGP